MKVSSAITQVSALETWLQETDAASPTAQAAPLASASAAAPPSTSQGRDVAEGLLELNVWSTDVTAAARHLATAVPPPAEDSHATTLWADHIFAPLTATQS
jgi:hypothetical protein